MSDSIRKIVKNIINEIVQEAVPGKHWQLRIDTRLKSPKTEPNFPFHHVDDKLKFLEKISFEGQKNIALRIYTSKQIYTAHGDGKERPSKGNTVWAVIRGNELDTLLFDSPDYQVQNTQYTFTIEQLINFARHKGPDENGIYWISDKDIEKGLAIPAKTELKKQLDLPVVELKTGLWYIDADNEKLIYLKNTKKTMSFDEAFEQLPEEDLAKVTDHSYWIV